MADPFHLYFFQVPHVRARFEEVAINLLPFLEVELVVYFERFELGPLLELYGRFDRVNLVKIVVRGAVYHEWWLVNDNRDVSHWKLITDLLDIAFGQLVVPVEREAHRPIVGDLLLLLKTALFVF